MDYRELYEAWKKEKENKKLQRLDKNFYTELCQYIRMKREELQMVDEKTLRGLLISEESNNIERLLTSLVECRCRKILNSVLDGSMLLSEVLTSEEEIAYNNVLSGKEGMEKILKETLRGRIPQVKEIKAIGKPKRILIRFLQAIPAIVGPDMASYGPFKVEDIASIPAENAESLIKRGIAVEVEI